jgi:hypothetical protein
MIGETKNARWLCTRDVRKMMMVTKNVDQQLCAWDTNQVEIAIQQLCTSN